MTSPTPQINQDFLFALLREAGPSGQERRTADVWKREAASFARVSEDHFGNVYAELGPGDAPTIALMGHLDEIGLMVSHVGDEGLLSVLAVGGWDPQVLVGQRIRLLAPEGDLIGVIGKKAIHMMDPDERKNASKIEDLWIDVGLGKEEAAARIPVGTVGVIDSGPLTVGERIVGRALDNRVGGFIVLEALRALVGAELKYRVVAVGTSQEEIGLFGARVSGHHLNPVAGIAVDLTHETKQPGVSEKKYGQATFGSGANLSISARLNPTLHRQLVATAQAEGIPYTVGASPHFTATDGDALSMVRSGVPTAVVSAPARYMHSPNEMVDARDVGACIQLIAAWIRGLGTELDFTR